MRYLSTRGSAPVLSFEEVVLTGLASDGGLYVPETVPTFSTQEWQSFRGLSYPELAFRIMWPFIASEIPEEDLKHMINESYAGFDHPDIAPLVNLEANLWLLELFHGPTLAFKDFALQFLGRLLDYILAKRNQRIVIVGATSGDTGSAAIAGCRGRERMDIYILYPHGRISEVQRRQMTTVLDDNVHNIAVNGMFDDCQDIVKSLFGDAAFRTKHALAAVNSINWARILAQVVYYAYAALKLGAPEQAINFSVPTGNFGDIYAGYIAKRMSLPISRLVIATNQNDILARCVASGTYGMAEVRPSLSPSMDIQISSNFERLLFDLHGRDGAHLAARMQDFRRARSLTLTPEAHARLKEEFDAVRISEEETLATIKAMHAATGALLDPHSAIGVAAARAMKTNGPMVALATAHPAKFPDAVEKATGIRPALPLHLQDLFSKEERCAALPNDVAAVKQFIDRTQSA